MVYIPKTFLEKTKSGAVITVDEFDIKNGGGLGKYVCDHTARIINAFRQSKIFPNLKIIGFIHVPSKPLKKHFSEVLGIGIFKIFKKLSKKRKSVRIMLTGFTKFGTIQDNATGNFLFGDGKSIVSKSFGFIKPSKEAINRLDKMIINQFGKDILCLPLTKDKINIGRTYHLENNFKIELILVRLPVHSNILIKPEGDYSKFYQHSKYKILEGDIVQHILNYAILFTEPDAIISLGVDASMPSNYFEIETNIFGLDPKYLDGKKALYLNGLGKGINKKLASIYKKEKV